MTKLIVAFRSVTNAPNERNDVTILVKVLVFFVEYILKCWNYFEVWDEEDHSNRLEEVVPIY